MLAEAFGCVTEQTLKNGFRACGLCPFNVENVNFIKLKPGPQTSAKTNYSQYRKLKDVLTYIESKIGNKLNSFKLFETESFEGLKEDLSLFELWRNIKNELKDLEPADSEKAGEPADSEKTGNQEGILDITDEEPTQLETVSDVMESGSEDQRQFHGDISIASTSHELQTPPRKIVPESVTSQCVHYPPNVPSPFKRALFWPQPPVTTKKHKKEKIPSVDTSADWQKYHEKKEKVKKQKLEEKEQRARVRVEKKCEKERIKAAKNNNKDLESDTSEESWIESDDSLEGINLLDDSDEACELKQVSNLGVGDFVLVTFSGGKRKTVLYRYVCIIQKIFPDKEIEVMAMKCANESKTVFRMDEKDVSVIKKTNVLGQLPSPELFLSGDRMKYKFSKPVDVFESS